VRGGQGETELGNILKSPNLFDLSNLTNLFKNLGINTEDNAEDIKLTDIPLIYRWATFINFMSNKTPEKEETDIQVELTDTEIISKSRLLAEEIRLIKEGKAEPESESESGNGKERSPTPAFSKRTMIKNLITKIFNRPASARPVSARPPSASARPPSASTRPPSASARPPSASTRPVSANSRVKPSSTFLLPLKKVDISLVVDEELTKIITEFDDAFKGILTVVNDACQGKGKGSNSSNSSNSSDSNFKNMISIVKRLPDIDTSLPHLLHNRNKNLRDRYESILYLLNAKCTGWRGAICSTAIKILRDKDIQSLYDKLKKNADNTVIDDATLLEFIKDVLPIMKQKLNGMGKFNDHLDELDKINEKLSAYHPPAKGGKKSTKKVILGKERCIYKVQGSKKEHIKHKGALIPVADYKKLMGARSAR
jgi:hypothetical protein